jgi:hypothetical protein
MGHHHHYLGSYHDISLVHNSLDAAPEIFDLDGVPLFLDIDTAQFLFRRSRLLHFSVMVSKFNGGGFIDSACCDGMLDRNLGGRHGN